MNLNSRISFYIYETVINYATFQSKIKNNLRYCRDRHVENIKK